MSKLFRLSDEQMDSFIKFNKIIKANMLMFDSETKSVVGFGYNNDELGIVKEVHNIEYQFPILPFDIVFLGKDMASLQKESRETGIPVYIEVEDYHWNRNCAIRLFCGQDSKPCFNFRNYMNEYRMFSKSSNGTPEIFIENIRSSQIFERVFSAKASDGIISVNVSGFTIFVPPTFIGALKTEIIDLSITSYGNYLYISFIVHKKKGIDISISYLMMNMNYTQK